MAATNPPPDKAGRPASPNGKSRKVLLLASVGSLAVLVVSAIAWLLLMPPQMTPIDRMKLALKLIDENRPTVARSMARQLESEKFSDPQFPGALDYVQGMAAFQMAQRPHDVDYRAQLLTAVSHLRSASRADIPDPYRLNSQFALGKSLYQLGQARAALVQLQMVLEAEDDRFRGESAGMIAEIKLDPGMADAENLADALRLNRLMAERLEDTPATRLQHAEILLKQGELQAATDVATTLKDVEDFDRDSKLILARVAIADRRYQEALSLLGPMAEENRLRRQAVTRQALYLLGVTYCHLADLAVSGSTDDAARVQQQKRLDDAKKSFRQTVDQFDGTHEALAAGARLAKLLQADGNNEGALTAYGRVLKSVRQVEEFRNRWMTANELREQVLKAWNQWIESRDFSDAIALTDVMSPLIPTVHTEQLAALARRRWAERTEMDLATLSAAQRRARQGELEQRWTSSGASYARLASMVRRQEDQHAALWTSAEQFRKGKRPEDAEAQLNLLIADRPADRWAAALVMRAETRIDRDEPKLALQDLETVLEKFPRDPAAFRARFLFGVCHKEQNDYANAEKAWRKVLAADDLRPLAVEWRDSLLELACLLEETASADWRQVSASYKRMPTETAVPVALAVKPRNRWNEAIERLEEYLARYPEGPGLIRVRQCLAASQESLAELDQHEYHLSLTDESRRRMKISRQGRLAAALEHYRWIRERLAPLSRADQLEHHEVAIWKFSEFAIPGLMVELEQYPEAVSAFSALINRFGEDPRLLPCYVQMARCYQQMGKPIEARSLLEQARLLLEQSPIPQSAFASAQTNLTQTEWETWLRNASDAFR